LPVIGNHKVITGHQRSSCRLRGVSELVPCFPLLRRTSAAHGSPLERSHIAEAGESRIGHG
jgi:hypothetical protein